MKKKETYNTELRNDCPGDDHPVTQKPHQLDTGFTRAEKWIIWSCIAVLIIFGIIVCLNINAGKEDGYVEKEEILFNQQRDTDQD